MEYNEFKLKASLRILVQKEQFEYWLEKLFYLNDSLNKEYDSIYQGTFYIVISELFNEGEVYLNEIVNIVLQLESEIKKKWYLRLQKGIIDMKSNFSQYELYFIDYKRHNICHIFQDTYEEIQKDGKIKKERTLKKDSEGKAVKEPLNLISKEFQDILYKYGGEKRFDIHMNTILYPILNTLYKELQTLHKKEIEESSL